MCECDGISLSESVCFSSPPVSPTVYCEPVPAPTTKRLRRSGVVCPLTVWPLQSAQPFGMSSAEPLHRMMHSSGTVPKPETAPPTCRSPLTVASPVTESDEAATEPATSSEAAETPPENVAEAAVRTPAAAKSPLADATSEAKTA